MSNISNINSQSLKANVVDADNEENIRRTSADLMEKFNRFLAKLRRAARQAGADEKSVSAALVLRKGSSKVEMVWSKMSDPLKFLGLLLLTGGTAVGMLGFLEVEHGVAESIALTLLRYSYDRVGTPVGMIAHMTVGGRGPEFIAYPLMEYKSDNEVMRFLVDTANMMADRMGLGELDRVVVHEVSLQ